MLLLTVTTTETTMQRYQKSRGNEKYLWYQTMHFLDARLVLQYRCTQALAVDIHPAAQIGKGVLLDHGTGLVIGETAVVGNNVSILHNVTLGGEGRVLNK